MVPAQADQSVKMLYGVFRSRTRRSAADLIMKMGSWRLAMSGREQWKRQCSECVRLCPTGHGELSEMMRHEYRKLHKEPQRDSSGVLLSPKVGCDPGVSELSTIRVFKRVCDFVSVI